LVQFFMLLIFIDIFWFVLLILAIFIDIFWHNFS
jgi:hypothetical protein